MLGDADLPLRVEHRLVRSDNVEDNLLARRLFAAREDQTTCAWQK
jgi:hypothetical protein